MCLCISVCVNVSYPNVTDDLKVYNAYIAVSIIYLISKVLVLYRGNQTYLFLFTGMHSYENYMVIKQSGEYTTNGNVPFMSYDEDKYQYEIYYCVYQPTNTGETKSSCVAACA